MRPLRDVEFSLRQVIKQKIRRMDIDWPAVPEPDITGDDGLEWLYDSSRDYLDQLQVYKDRQINGWMHSTPDGLES